ncbi:MAG: hypothetical protein AAFS10_15335 [Myxococcota bacterium]
MTHHTLPTAEQLMLPFFLGTAAEGEESALPWVEGDDDVPCGGPVAVPESEEIPKRWLEVMPDVWRQRLLARAERTGAMNVWTLSAVTGVPTWQLRARLESDCERWEQFSHAVDDLARRATSQERSSCAEQQPHQAAG